MQTARSQVKTENICSVCVIHPMTYDTFMGAYSTDTICRHEQCRQHLKCRQHRQSQRDSDIPMLFPLLMACAHRPGKASYHQEASATVLSGKQKQTQPTMSNEAAKASTKGQMMPRGPYSSPKSSTWKFISLWSLEIQIHFYCRCQI